MLVQESVGAGVEANIETGSLIFVGVGKDVKVCSCRH